MIEEIDSLLSDLKTVHEDLKPISTGIVVVAELGTAQVPLRLPGIRQPFLLPTFAPSTQETRQVLSEY